MNSLISLLDQKVATPGETYEVTGDTFNLIKRLLIALWRGENIGDTATVKRISNGAAGILLNGSAKGTSSSASYPWHVYNTTTGSTGQVQVNGGDGQVAQLNSFVSQISGHPTDTKFGSPAAYPQLSITGNGYIYAKATPTTAGTASPLTSLDITFETSPQTQDTSNPAAYYWMLLATISNYAVDGMGNVSFTLNNVFGSAYGPSTLIYCGAAINTY
jgi:hypothetical protein